MKDSNNGDAEALRKHAREDMQDSLDEELEMELDDHRMEEILAGIGEKPMMRSGPWRLMVCTLAAAISSLTSSQSARTKPPRPRMLW